MPYSSATLPKLFSPKTIVATIVAAMSACVLGLVVWKALDARTAALAQGERDIHNLAHSLAEHAAHTIQSVDVAMSAMIDLLKYRRPDRERFEAHLRSTVRALPQIREIGVLDADGEWIYSSLDMRPLHTNSDRDYFARHQDSADPSLYISGPLRSRSTGRLSIVLSKRVSDQDGGFAGVVLSTIDVDYFENFYETFRLDPHAGVTLLRRDGVVLTHWPLNTWRSGLVIPESFKTRVEQAASGYTKVKSLFDGRVKFYGYERGQQYPIVLVVALPEAAVLAGWHQDLRNDIFVAMVLMGSVVVLAILLSREFGRRTRVAQLLREREASYRLLADNVADIVVRLDHTGRFLFVSQSVEPVLGFRPDELVGKSCFDFVHADDLPAVRQATAELTDPQVSRTVQFKTIRADKSAIWVEINFKLTVADGAHRADDVVGVLRDVTARRKMEDELNALNERLAELATTDGLTGLANRRTFDVALPREFRDRENISVIMIDIDHFKGFNDSLGHQAGDECLKRVAGAIADVTDNTSAVAARYGGEEFAVILPGIGEMDAMKVAEAIRLKVRALEIAHPASGRGIVSLSLGVAARTADIASETALLSAADFALYEAKRSGRNCSVAASTLTLSDHSAGRKQYA